LRFGRVHSRLLATFGQVLGTQVNYS
jgi:hypothetical protein